ncbi:MAG: PLP-dependent aminotransferase family protein [Verrucomicrobiaceae bacterium]|nr:MAG: PLP-dependent aminotransferase family protein [Verrucomicrobiaceae bacterium]
MSHSGEALYETVAGKVAGLIHTGTLRPGDRLPSVRRACAQNGVSMATVVQAYLRLENQGLIEARPKSGFFVKAARPGKPAEPWASRPAVAPVKVGVGALQAGLFELTRHPDIVPFGAATPGAELFPVARLSRIMSAISRSAGGRGLSYDMPPGAESLRRQIARRALDWGTTLEPHDLITTCGGTEALMLCLRAVTKPGDVVAVESPTYFCVLQAIEELGLKALEIPMHPRDGMDVEALERCLRTRRIAACLAVPNFNNPLGSLMPDEAKQRLLEILSRREIPLIEDDIYGDLHFGPQRPRVVHSWDRGGLVMLCGSFSKTLAPGYRVGWVAPGRFHDKVQALKLTSTLATGTLPQLAIAEFLANGGYDHYLRSVRQTYAAQVSRMSEALAAALPENVRLTRPAGGFVLWVELPAKVDSLELHTRALEEKISIAPGPLFSARGSFRNFIRINCGHPWNARLQRAVETLGVLVHQMSR